MYHISRPSSACQLNAILHLNGVLLACQYWPNIQCWLDSFVIFQGIWTSILKIPYIFVISEGVGGEMVIVYGNDFSG